MRAELLQGASGQVLQGPLLLSPQLHHDGRGFLFESWNRLRWQQLLASHGQEPVDFVQDNHSRSCRGVLRGLHWQKQPHAQAKLVRCVVGEIFDVAVDLRRGSPTFGQWISTVLSASNHRQLWVPVGFAHGFLTLSEQAEVLYRTTDFWNASCECSLRWDDPQLAIAWPQLTGVAPILSEKDARAPLLGDLMGQPEAWS